MSLCKFAEMLGTPGKGIHSVRLFNIAILDVIQTIILAYVISYFSKYNFYYVLIFLFLLAIFLHRLFCVKTTVDIWLFG